MFPVENILIAYRDVISMILIYVRMTLAPCKIIMFIILLKKYLIKSQVDEWFLTSNVQYTN